MQAKRRGFYFLAALTILLLLSSCVPIQPPAQAPVAEPAALPPTRILIIGDLFLASNEVSIDAILTGLAGGAEPPLILETSFVSLWGSLKEQWDDGAALEAIQSGNWDVVILEQDLVASGGNVQYFDRAVATYQDAVRQFHAAIKESGAQTVLLASAEGRFRNKKTAEDVYLVNTALADELNITVAPVGLAVERAKATDPTIVFYGTGETINSVEGLYLAAAVLYTTIYDRSPEGITWLPTDDLGDDPKLDDIRRALTITPELRDLLLRIAWETVQEYAD